MFFQTTWAVFPGVVTQGQPLLNGRKGKSVMGIIGDDSKWHDEFFDTMRQNAGYMCDWQCPFSGLWHSAVFVVLLVTVVFILPCVLWLPYAFPIAVAVDLLFGEILRQNAKCPHLRMLAQIPRHHGLHLYCWCSMKIANLRVDARPSL